MQYHSQKRMLLQMARLRVIDESQYHTIVTLYQLGNSFATIGAIVGASENTVRSELMRLLGPNLHEVKGTVKKRKFKDAMLLSIAIESDNEKNKISALNAINVEPKKGNASGSDNVGVDTASIKLEILSELNEL